MMTCLTLKIYNIPDPSKFPFIDNPGERSFSIAIQSLTKMGALDEYGLVTQVGRIVHEFPLDPYSSFCLYNLFPENDTIKRDVVTIIAIMSVDNIYLSFGKNKNKSEADNRKQFHVQNSDHLTKLNLFYKFVTAQNKKEFCAHFGLKRKSLDTIILVRDQLMNTMHRIGESLTKSNFSGGKKQVYDKNKTAGELLPEIVVNFVFDKTKILNILKRSFFTKIAELTNFGEYRLKNTAVKAKIHPESVVFLNKNRPKEVVFHSLVNTSKMYINNVSQID